MKRKIGNAGIRLDRALEEVRSRTGTPGGAEEAAGRVLNRLREEYNKVVAHPAVAAGPNRIQSCSDFRALIPAYLSSSLASSRKLLFEDHIRECAGCRKAADAARRGMSSSPARAVPAPAGVWSRNGRRYARWTAVAAAALLVALALQTSPIRDLLWPIEIYATPLSVEGGFYDVTAQGVRVIPVGQRIERYQSVRTGEGSGTILELPDGSRIEMAARSELSLDRAGDDVKVRLKRGSFIVNASNQKNGQLFLETADCVVCVVKTVVSVSASIKGSRVSVLEGRAELQRGGSEEWIEGGQQVFTNPEMGALPVAQEISWSRDAEIYEARLKEMAIFSQDFAKRVEDSPMRLTSNLVPLVPAETLVLASLPNLTQPFSESYELFRRRVQENPVLSSWWGQNAATGRVSADEIVRRITEVGSYLGPEVILAFAKEAKAPVLLAETTRSEDLVRALEEDIAQFSEAGTAPAVRVARNAQELAALSGTGLAIYVEHGIMIAADPAQVRKIAAVRSGQLPNGFEGTPLYNRLRQAYTEGVGLLLAADLQQMLPPEARQTPGLALGDVQQLVLEQKTGVGNASSRAMLGFNQARRGMASWLAEPGPMGALEFVSPGAYAVSAALVKDPALILDDFFMALQQDPNAWGDVLEFQRQRQLDFRHDLAEPLGNEFLIAMDGPVLPKPSWKIVIEVTDGPRLENAIQWAVTGLNRDAIAQGREEIAISSESVDGRVFHRLSSPQFPSGIHYTFWVGYIIVAPSRALLIEAIQNHDNGNTLARSPEFRAHMPRDAQDYLSALLYQNVRAMTSGVPDDVLNTVLGHSMDNALTDAAPRLVGVYGEADRIRLSAQGAFGINLAGMLGLHGMLEAAGLRYGEFK